MAECDFCLSMSQSGHPIGTMGSGCVGWVGRVVRRAGRSGPPNPVGGWTPTAGPTPRPGPDGAASVGGRVETTQEELAAFKLIRRLLGPTQPVGYKDRPHKRHKPKFDPVSASFSAMTPSRPIETPTG